MKYWYDAEFHEDGKTIDLISIAFVAEDGREYYAVNSDADYNRIFADEWLLTNVMSQIPREANTGLWKPKALIAAEVLDFLLAGEGKPELWAWYSAYDHVSYAQLWGKMIDLPEGLPMYTNDLKSFLHWALPRVQDRDGLPAQADGEHDALADARHVKVRYDWIVEQQRQTDTRSFVEGLLKDKRESMKELIYRLIEAKKDDRDYIRAANIEIEKFGLQAEIDVLEYVVNG